MPCIARIALLSAFVGAVAGCSCGDDGVTGSSGIPEAEQLTVDFGRVRVNETARIGVRLFNRGRARLRITSVERVDLPAAFRLTQPPTEIAPDSSVKLQFSFAPEQEGAGGGKLVVRTDAAEDADVEFTLKGEGVRSNVVIEPPVLSFGLVEVGLRATLPIVVANQGLVREEIRIVSLAEGSAHFTAGPVPGGGEVIALEPGASAELPVTFEPRFADPAGFVSAVEFAPCPTCAGVTVTLRGTGIESFLVVDPPDCVDFGAVNPGSGLARTVTLSNLGTRPLRVLDTGLSGSTDFELTQAGTGDIEGGTDATVEITYRPDALGPDTGTLRVSTDDPRASLVELCLRGTGGGPDVSVRPERLSFGTVAVGVPRTKTLQIANLGASAGESTLRVTGARVRTAGGPFSVAFPAPLEIAVGHTATVDVTFAPAANGAAADVLELDTNDADRPLVLVPLDGTGRTLAPCQLQTTPATGTLSFGNVERGRRVVLSFSMRNTGAEDCLVDSLRLSPTTDAAFALEAGTPTDFTLAPGQLFVVRVAFEPPVARDYAGEALYNISNPAEPHRSVQLAGTSAKGCLLISPDELDFGTVGAACASRSRTITIYNSCTGAVTVESLELAPGSASFRLSSPDRPLPASVTLQSPLRVDARYVPPALGTDTGGLFVKTGEREAPYLVPLLGRATADAIQRDTFAQDERPAVDLLFVVDNSGSMSDNQTALAANFAAFMSYATQQQIDYRLAVTSTDVTEEAGWFVPKDRSRPHILTPSTPNVEAIFGQNVKLGTSGSATEQGLEAAYLALQPAAVANQNQGFLRDEALLSIIVVTDEVDQSPQSYGFYHSFFQSIKGARNSNMFSFSAVCITDPSNGTNYGETYIQMSRETGGLAISIDTGDWSRELERLGTLAFGRKSRFFLTSTPAAGEPVRVWIDGQEVPPVQGGIVIWSVDMTQKTLDFNSIAIPEPGSTLVVEYKVACT